MVIATKKQNRGGGRKPPPIAQPKSQMKFWQDSLRVHGDRFDYSKTFYFGSHGYICVTCRKHGDFWQMATNHLAGYGCSECAIQQVFHERHIPKEQRSDPATVYVIEIVVGEERFVKLGYSTNYYQRSHRYKHEQVDIRSGTKYTTTTFRGFQIERLTHARFRDRRIKPSVRFGGMTECYPVEMLRDLNAAVIEQLSLDLAV